MNETHDNETRDDRWLDNPRNVTRIVYGLAALCALSFAADLFYGKHPHFGFEGWFGFYAVYGFVGSVGLVLSAKWLRRWLKRDENYYEDYAAGGSADGAVDRPGDRDD